MNLLDENVLASQRERLLAWRVHVSQIGIDVARKGTSDEAIIPLLHELKRPTFFTFDSDFFSPSLRHARYCLVWLDVRTMQAADYIRRLLRRPEFTSQAKRMGTVVGVSASGLSVWRIHAENLVNYPWPPKRRK